MSALASGTVRMSSRERFAACMRHEQPDRVPIDIGATSLTGMRPGIQQALRDLLGFGGELQPTNTWIDARILDWAGTDFRGVGALADLPSPHIARPSPTVRVDCWGIRREHIDGEWQITHSPLRGASRADLDSYAWPEPRVDERQLAAWEESAKALRRDGRYVVVAEHPIQGVLEIGCWMCGYDEFLLAMAADPDFVRAFTDRLLEIQLAVVEQYYGVLGPHIDLTTNGDDFGTQLGSFMSPEMFAEFVAPPFAARIRRTKEIADCYFWHHSCGSVAALLDQIIDCGVDILNPVQTSAVGMEPAALKRRFGDRLTFWGAVDVQQFLPRAKPLEVIQRIHELIDTLGRDGGYVIAPGHQIQEDVPVDNLVAWVEAIPGRSPAA